MAISDKTRKMLWAKSHNQCAISKKPLVIKAPEAGQECVVGHECHIVSRKQGVEV